MYARLRRRVSIPFAIALMASVGAWQPSMTLAHASAPRGGAHHHGDGAGHRTAPSAPGQALPDACCDMCVAACSACPALPSASSLLAFGTPLALGSALPVQRTLARPAPPHLHPLPLGPPPLRVA